MLTCALPDLPYSTHHIMPVSAVMPGIEAESSSCRPAGHPTAIASSAWSKMSDHLSAYKEEFKRKRRDAKVAAAARKAHEMQPAHSL